MSLEQAILIVEDSRTEIQYLTTILTAYDIKVRVAEDGVAALQSVDKEHPTLVILDINLPKMNGYQVCKRLKRDPNTAHIPVIMLTSSDNATSTLKGLDAGVDDFIAKDEFIAENLMSTIRVYLNLPDDEAPSDDEEAN